MTDETTTYKTEDWNDCLIRIKRMVSGFPAADVAPVAHGQWVGVGYDKCSVCGGFELGRTKYCPNCGARMDGVSE